MEISDAYEDIHSFVEATLIERIGETGKKTSYRRSRNDQVALDMKLYTRDEITHLDGAFKGTFIRTFKPHGRTPGYIYARLYPSTESSATDAVPSFGCLF